MKLHVLSLFATSLVSVALATDEGTSCELPCRNGGVCRSSRGGASYCQCPQGYSGSYCEVKFVMCKSAEETCFSGRPCMRDTDMYGKTFHHCECDATQTDLTSLGAQQYCQHLSTVYCTNEATEVVIPGGGKTFSQSSSFCANGGVCKERNNKSGTHAGCTCPPQWAGDYCQNPSGGRASGKRSGIFSYRTMLLVMSFFFLSGLIATVAAFVQHGYKKVDRKKRRKRIRDEAEGERVKAEKELGRIRSPPSSISPMEIAESSDHELA